LRDVGGYFSLDGGVLDRETGEGERRGGPMQWAFGASGKWATTNVVARFFPSLPLRPQLMTFNPTTTGIDREDAIDEDEC